MNLGIEDVCRFVDLLNNDKLAHYSQERYNAGRVVIKGSDIQFRGAALTNPFIKLICNYVIFLILNSPFVQKTMLTSMAGLYNKVN